MTYAQMIACGFTSEQVKVWIRRGHLIRRLPGVYAVGYVSTGTHDSIWEAILWSGPGACLTAGSGAHHLGLILFAPGLIHVATPRCVRSRRGIRVHRRRRHGRVIVDGLPVAPLPELLVDLAATESETAVRRALAVLDVREQLDPQLIGAILAACRHGRPGSAALKRALGRHQPELAHVNGPLEQDFLLWLETQKLPIPKFNRTRCGIIVDAVWDELRLVVELDGRGNHHSRAQLARDAERQRRLEAAGYVVLRFTYADLHDRPQAIRAQLASCGL